MQRSRKKKLVHSPPHEEWRRKTRTTTKGRGSLQLFGEEVVEENKSSPRRSTRRRLDVTSEKDTTLNQGTNDADKKHQNAKDEQQHQEKSDAGSKNSKDSQTDGENTDSGKLSSSGSQKKLKVMVKRCDKAMSKLRGSDMSSTSISDQQESDDGKNKRGSEQSSSEKNNKRRCLKVMIKKNSKTVNEKNCSTTQFTSSDSNDKGSDSKTPKTREDLTPGDKKNKVKKNEKTRNKYSGDSNVVAALNNSGAEIDESLTTKTPTRKLMVRIKKDEVNSPKGKQIVKKQLYKSKKITSTESGSGNEKEENATKEETAKEKSIYDFDLSQNTETEDNTMTDVIDKLVKENKALVVKHRKKPKPKAKSKVQKKPRPSAVWHKVEKSLGIKPSDKAAQGAEKLTKSALNASTVSLLNASVSSPVAGASRKVNEVTTLKDTVEDGKQQAPKRVSFVNNPTTPRPVEKKRLLSKEFLFQQATSTPNNKTNSQGKDESFLSPILKSPSMKNLSLPTSATKNSAAMKSMDNLDMITNIENEPPLHDADEVPKFVTPASTPPVPRNPLKAINIIDVVKLPNLNLIKTTAQVHSPPGESLPLRQSFLKRNSIKASENGSTISTVNADSTKTSTNDDTFGFEEDISTITDSEENNLAIVEVEEDLSKKLKEIERLCPPKRPSSKEPEKRLKVANLFGVSPKKQRDIREVVEEVKSKRKRRAAAEKPAVIEMSSDVEEEETSRVDPDVTTQGDDVDVHLFEDLEDVTFDKSITNRTYGRSNRKKRKGRNFFIFQSESEGESETEEEKPKKKKPRKTKAEKSNEAMEKELNKFAEEFNSMCEEVENFELVIENEKEPEKDAA